MYGYPYSGVLREIPPCCDLAPTGLLSTHDRTFRKMSIRQCIARDLRKWYRHVITMYHNFRQQKATSKFLDSRCCKYKPISTAEELRIFWNTFTYQIAFQLFIDLWIPWDTSAGTTSKTLGELSKFLHVQTSFSVSFCYPIFVSPQILSNVIPQLNKHGTKMYQTRFFAQISANLKQIYVHPGLLDSCPSLKLLRTQLRCPWPIKSWTSQTRDGLGTRHKKTAMS